MFKFLGKRLIIASILFASLFGITSLGQDMKVEAAVIGDDYPALWRNSVPWAYIDTWGMYSRECTSFAAYRLSSANKFNLNRGGYSWNGYEWGGNALKQGYRVDMNPAVGSIAWFGSGKSGASAYGHVAWVADVAANNITIEEYNYNAGQGSNKYWKRTISKDAVSGYIHFKDLNFSTSDLSGAKYKKNQKVRVKSTAGWESDGTNIKSRRGWEGVISEVRSDAKSYSKFSYKVVYDNKDYNTHILEQDLEPASSWTLISSQGSHKFTSRGSVKAEPRQSSKELAYYDKGELVHYDYKTNCDGYEWVSYIAASGNRRYIAIRKL